MTKEKLFSTGQELIVEPRTQPSSRDNEDDMNSLLAVPLKRGMALQPPVNILVCKKERLIAA